MENTDIPQFHTYREEIEFEGTLIQADIFIDNKMLEDKNSFLISFLCKSNTIYKGRILHKSKIQWCKIEKTCPFSVTKLY